MNKTSFAMAGLLSAALGVSAQDYVLHSFKKTQLTDKFWGEGAHFADFNHDGKMDVVSGPYWYEGPEFQKRHELYPATHTFKLKKADGTEEMVPGFEGGLGPNNAYSDNFLTYTWDFNGDGWTDVLVLGFPGAESWWFENPQGKDQLWRRHTAIDVTDVVKTETCIIRREQDRGVEANAHQIRDCISVFGTVEAPNCHSAWIDIRRINLKRPKLDPVRERSRFGWRWAIMSCRRHQLRSHILQNIPPQIRSCESLVCCGKLIQRQITLLLATTVTFVAVCLQDRDDLCVKIR